MASHFVHYAQLLVEWACFIKLKWTVVGLTLISLHRLPSVILRVYYVKNKYFYEHVFVMLFIITYLTILLALVCHKAVSQSINQSINQSIHPLTVEHIFLSCRAYHNIRYQYCNLCSLQELFQNTHSLHK